MQRLVERMQALEGELVRQQTANQVMQTVLQGRLRTVRGWHSHRGLRRGRGRTQEHWASQTSSWASRRSGEIGRW